jgi:two-component system sensor histidine kinase YesM
LDCQIPRLTLQPLVENAIIHGLSPSEKFGSITLNAACYNGFLDITVEDNGIGMNPQQLELIKTMEKEKNRDNPSFNNIGIPNVESRLKLLYGDSCGLSFESQPGKYTKVTVKILMER